jgi:hypothetical protein
MPTTQPQVSSLPDTSLPKSTLMREAMNLATRPEDLTKPTERRGRWHGCIDVLRPRPPGAATIQAAVEISGC